MGRFSRFPKLLSLLIAVAISILSYVVSDSNPFGIGEKSYKELELHVEARILPDGSMTVRETRILEFDGEFSRYRRNIPHIGYGNLVDLRISEPDTPYTWIQTPAGRPEGRFTLSRAQISGIDNDIIEFFFHVRNQKMIFTIEYRLTDVVNVHIDVAEVYWKFIGAGRSQPIGTMSVTLMLPPGGSPNTIKFWGHGPSKGVVEKISEEQLSWKTTDLPPNRFLEGRVIFPKGLVPQAKILTNKIALPLILVEEQRWADRRVEEQRLALLEVTSSFVVGMSGIIFAIWIFRRYGRKFKMSMEIEYYRELPGTYSPAEAGCLIENGTIRPPAVAATFMDLARRGFIRLEQTHNPQSEEDILIHQLKPSGEAVAPHERLLLEFFFVRVGRMQPAVWFSALDIYRKSQPESTAGFITSFQAAVKASMATMGFWEPTNRGKSYTKVGAAISLAGAIISLMSDSAVLASSFTLVFISMGTAWGLCRDFTPIGQQHYDLWQAFRRFLKDFSNLDRAQLPQLIIWEHYLVYAVVLGVAKEVIKQLPIVYPQLREPDSQFGPYWGGVYRPGWNSAEATDLNAFSGLTSFDKITDAMESTWQDAYSAVSSSSGSSGGGGDGGGFSGGGGDGGGGGGGDAD